MIRRGAGGESSLCVVPAKSIHTDSCVSCRRGTARLRHVIRLSSAVGMRRPYLSSWSCRRGVRAPNMLAPSCELGAPGARWPAEAAPMARRITSLTCGLMCGTRVRACGCPMRRKASGRRSDSAVNRSRRRVGRANEGAALVSRPAPTPLSAFAGCTPAAAAAAPPMAASPSPVPSCSPAAVAPPMAKSERREISQSRRWSALAHVCKNPLRSTAPEPARIWLHQPHSTK